MRPTSENFLGVDENGRKLIVVMLHHSEYTKNPGIVHFKWVTCMVWLYLNKAVFFKGQFENNKKPRYNVRACPPGTFGWFQAGASRAAVCIGDTLLRAQVICDRKMTSHCTTLEAALAFFFLFLVPVL